MFVSRLFSRALWSPLFSLLPFSYPLSLSLSLSLSLVFAIVVVAKEKNKNRRFARSPVNQSSRQQTLCYASPSSSLNQSPIHLFLSLSLSSPSL